MYASVAVIQSDPAGNRKLNKAKLYLKIDVLVALSMAPGSMSADENVSATSPRDDPEFKPAVKYQWFPTIASFSWIGRSREKARNALHVRHHRDDGSHSFVEHCVT